MNETLKTIANRRSVRRFQTKQLSESDLQAIINAGLQAPTGNNDQSWFFSVVQKKELIDEISDQSKAEMRKSPIDWVAKFGQSEKFHIFYNAPTVIIVSARKEAITPNEDAHAATENILLAAESLNIGSCWIGFANFYFNNSERLAKFGIPEGYDMKCAVALGYKPEGLKLSPPPKKRDNYFKILR